MFWVDKIVSKIVEQHPDGEILIQSGASPSGTYHFGHLREIITADAIMLILQERGRQARHIHFVDDLDGLRKIPANVPNEFEKYLGKPLCDVPAPDGSDKSYGDYFLAGFTNTAKTLGIDMEVIHSHKKYRSGYFVEAIEVLLEHMDIVKETLETISGRKLDEHWSPIQVMEDGYLKNRKFVAINTIDKTVEYLDKAGKSQRISYKDGGVKLDWRLDWPARWWLGQVHVEPFGRDHASKGGSYDTGAAIMHEIFKKEPPYPVPYEFVNRSGDTKKMSASRGTGVEAAEVAEVLPPEVVRFFMLRTDPNKLLYFDQEDGIVRLVDEFSELSAKSELNKLEEELLYLSTRGLKARIVSKVPFSHLVESYQAALKDPEQTLKIINRTEYAPIVDKEKEVIVAELNFIANWLDHWAPEDVKFELSMSVDPVKYNDQQTKFLSLLASQIEQAPINADGEWFHKAIYDLKDQIGLEPKILFQTLYQLIINKDYGPRAGWFLSMLPRPWLIDRLNLKK